MNTTGMAARIMSWLGYSYDNDLQIAVNAAIEAIVIRRTYTDKRRAILAEVRKDYVIDWMANMEYVIPSDQMPQLHRMLEKTNEQ